MRAARARRALLPLTAMVLVGCEALLTDPADTGAELALVLAPARAEAAAGGAAEAFARADRVHLRFVRPDSAVRDTLLPLAVRDGVGRARLALRTNERVEALGVVAEIRRGQAALFQGQRVVRVTSGVPTSVEIELSAVVDRVVAERGAVALVVGDSVQLRAAALFATGDTVSGVAFEWFSADPSIASVSRTGVVTGRRPGETGLLVRSGARADTVGVRVTAPR